MKSKLEVAAEAYVRARDELQRLKGVKNSIRCSEFDPGDPTIGVGGTASCPVDESVPMTEWCENCQKRAAVKLECQSASLIASNAWRRLKRATYKHMTCT